MTKFHFGIVFSAVCTQDIYENIPLLPNLYLWTWGTSTALQYAVYNYLKSDISCENTCSIFESVSLSEELKSAAILDLSRNALRAPRM
jgi:hypothetical protein